MEVKELIFGAAHVVSKQETRKTKSQNFYILVAETLLNDDQSVRLRLKTLAKCMFQLRPRSIRGAGHTNGHGIEYLSIHKIESVPA